MQRWFPLLTLALWACSEVPATNPHDPEAPASARAPGVVTGSLAPPAGYSLDRLADAAVELRRLSDPTDVAFDATIDGEGRFTLEGVVPGTYEVTVRVVGMRAPPANVEVPIDGRVDLGLLQLEAVTDAFVTGVARRAGVAAGDQQGIFVQALGTPDNATTGDDGRFLLQVTPGTHTLRATAPGYAPVERANVEVAAGETVDLSDMPLELDGAPGRLRGVVKLAPGFDADAIGNTTHVRVFAGEESDPHATLEPSGEEAAFQFELAAGTWRLEIERRGFQTDTRTLDLTPGADDDIGVVTLFPLGQSRGVFTGRAELAGQPEGEHGGTRVEVVGTPYVALTTADGRYQLAVLSGRYGLKFSHPGYGTGELDPIDVAEGQEVEVAPVTLSGSPGTVRGSVRLQGDLATPEQVAQVDVSLVRAGDAEDAPAITGRSDARGVFVLDGVAPGDYTLIVALDGFETRRVPLTVPFGQVLEVGQIDLRGVSITVRVQGVARLERRPDHAGITVRVADTEIFTTTDPDGAYTLFVPYRRAERTLRFTRAGYSLVTATVVAPAEEDVQAAIEAGAPGAPVVIDVIADPDAVTLAARPGSIRGQARLAAGFDPTLLQEVSVRLLDFEDPDEPFAQTTPAADGFYLFDDVPPGFWLLELALADFVPQTVLVEVEPDVETPVAPRVLSPDLSSARRFLAGVARRACAGDCDHGGIRVEAVGTPFVAVTGAGGDYQLEVLGDRALTLVFSAPGYETASLPGLRAAEEGINAVETTVILDALPGAVRAFTTLRRYGTAGRLALVDVALLDPSAPDDPLRSQNPDARGEVRFADVAPGTYQVRVSAPGYVTQQSEALVVAPAAEVLAGVFDLEHQSESDAAVSLAGTVTLEGLGAQAGPTVSVRLADAGLPFAEPQVVGGDGAFAFPASAEERYTLNITHAGYQPRSVGPVSWDAEAEAFTLDAGGALDVQLLRRRDPGRVRGVVNLRSFGSPQRLQAVDVALLRGAETVATVQPDAEGVFSFDGVLPDEYTLRADGVGYEPQQRPVVVPPSGDVVAGVLDLQHQSEGPSAVSLGGRITLIGREDHAGTRVQVRIVDGDLPFGPALSTDAAGDFALAASPEERYAVTIARDGYDAVAPIGPLAWDAVDARFEDEGGSGVAATLVRSPIAGRVNLRVVVQPDWLPQAERYARVRLVGPDPQVREGIATGQAVAFTNLSEGTHTVVVERIGFTSVEREVTLTPSNPTTNLGDLTVGLDNLAAARLDLRGHPVDACDLRVDGVSLVGADLSGAELTGSFGDDDCGGRGGPLDLGGATLQGADLTGASFVVADPDRGRASLRGADLAGAELTGADLRTVSAAGASFVGATLTRAELGGALLSRADFTSATLTNARFVAVDPNGRNATWPDLPAPAEALPTVPCDRGAPRPAVELTGALFDRANLSGAFLPGVDLAGVSFGGAQLIGTDLRATCLFGARLTQIDLSQAIVDDADASSAQFTASLLEGTSLRGTSLVRASLVNTVLDRADVRPSPRAACRELMPWEAYEADERCGQDPAHDALCRCRTLLTDASLAGANLVGTLFEGVDLAGASLLGVTIGEANGLPSEQRLTCMPEAFHACRSTWDILQACGQSVGDLDEAGWARQCAIDPTDAETLQLQPLCVVQTYEEQGCVGFGEAVCRSIDQPPPVTVNACSFASLQADEAAQRPLGSACASIDGQIRYVHEACITTPTLISGARLDRAQMTAVVLNGIELEDTLLRGTSMESGVFIDNAFANLDLTEASFFNAALDGARLVGLVMARTDFGGASLRGAFLQGNDLSSADFSGADLVGATIDADGDASRPASFANADLRGVELIGVQWPSDTTNRLNMVGADLSGAVVSQGTLRGVDLSEALLRSTTLIDVDLTEAAFANAVFIGGDLRPASLQSASMSGATFDGVRGASPGVDLRGAYLGSTQWRNADMGRSDLTGAQLLSAVMVDGSFTQADFIDANLFRARLVRVDLSGTDFTGANLREAQVFDSNFERTFVGPARITSMRDASLKDADFSRSDLQYVDFRGADMCRASFEDAYMRNADLTQTCNLTFYFGAYDGADMTNARICTRDQANFQSRNDYEGNPLFVNCANIGVCPRCP